MSSRTVKFIAKRLALGVLTLFLVSVVVFFATQALPANAAQAILGKTATPQALAALSAKLHLNESVVSQYLHWLSGLFHGSLGTSAATQQSVVHLLSGRLANSAFLVLVSAVIAIPLSIGLGVLMAMRRDQAVDHGLSTSTLLVASLPGVRDRDRARADLVARACFTCSRRCRCSDRGSTRGTSPASWSCRR